MIASGTAPLLSPFVLLPLLPFPSLLPVLILLTGLLYRYLGQAGWAGIGVRRAQLQTCTHTLLSVTDATCICRCYSG